MKLNGVSWSALIVALIFTNLLIAFPIDLYAQEDTTPPELVDFSFSPTTVDVATGAATVTATSHVTDDISGLSDIIVNFESPSGLHSAGTSNSTRISGTAYDGVYESVITIQQFAEEGTWIVTSVSLFDEVRNGVTYYVDDLEALGFPTELEVVSEPAIDNILFFFDESVENGTLQGSGKKSRLANKRLKKMRSMLEVAYRYIEKDKLKGACKKYKRAYKRCDGEKKPPDYVIGESVSELAEMIDEVMISLGCK